MSYEQYIADGTVYIVGEPDDNVQYYGYDDLGHVQSVSFNWAANLFKTSDDEQVKAVAFYTTDNNCSYDVYIVDLGTEKPSYPVTGTPSPVFSGNMTYAGYHTLELKSPITLGAGHYFSVITRLEESYDFPTAVEDSLSHTSNFAVNAAESYFSGSSAPFGNNVSSWRD